MICVWGEGTHAWTSDSSERTFGRRSEVVQDNVELIDVVFALEDGTTA